MISLFDRVENTVTSIFSFSHNVFKSHHVRVVKSQECELKGKEN